MTAGELDRAIHRARNLFDKWNEVTGAVDDDSSRYWEFVSCIEDAVHCGAQAATKDFKRLEGETQTMFQLYKPKR